MVELDQFKYTLSTYVPMLKELGASLNLDAKKERIAELSRYMEAPDFWDNPEKSQESMKNLKSMKDDMETYAHFEAINTICRVIAMSRLADQYGCIIYSHYGESATGGEYD